MTGRAKTPVLMDVDTGVDDAYAMAYLLGGDDVELIGVTCVAGNVPLPKVIQNTRAWLDICGAPRVLVHAGATGPLVAPLLEEEGIHGSTGLGYATLSAARPIDTSLDAVDFWIRAVRERPGQITGVATGPLTNIALAIHREPEFLHLLGRLIIMGGAFNHPGNTTPASEWNIAVDPEAAGIVAEASTGLDERAPIWVGLNVTETIALRPEHLAELRHKVTGETSDQPNPLLPTPDDPALLRHLLDAIRLYFEGQEAEGDGYTAFMHDPAAAALALDPSLAEYIVTNVAIELDGTHTRGATVPDFKCITARPANAAVTVRYHSDAFIDRLIERLAVLITRTMTV